MSIELTAARIISSFETKETLDRIGTSMNFVSLRAETLVLKAILKFTNGRAPELSEIFDIQRELLRRTNDKKTIESFEKATQHLKETKCLNTYQLDDLSSTISDLLIEAEVALKEKHLDTDVIVHLYNIVHNSATLSDDKTVLKFLERERGNFIK